jgi:hypothetical protein
MNVEKLRRFCGDVPSRHWLQSCTVGLGNVMKGDDMMKTKRLNKRNQRVNSPGNGRFIDLTRKFARGFVWKPTRGDRVANDAVVDRDKYRCVLVSTVDSIERQIERLHKKANNTQPWKCLSWQISEAEAMRDEMLDGLLALGLRPMPHTRQLDTSLHEVVKTRPTSRLNRDGLVVKVMRSGYLEGENVWRRARVVVLRYKSEIESADRQPEDRHDS